MGSAAIVPTETATHVEVTPEDTKAAVDQISRALRAGDAQGISTLLTDPVWLTAGPLGDIGESISRGDAVSWLETRWGKKRTVVSSDYVEHFVLLEIETTGWPRVDPMQDGSIDLHLHRFNAQGEEEPVQGVWRIDAIIYQ